MAGKRRAGYDVGYGKPPVRSRFRPGRSGNPRGRPKGAGNLGTVLAKTLRERVAVTENGTRRSISKLEAIIKQLVNKAAAADPKATAILLNIVRFSETQPGAEEQSSTLVNEDDRKVMEQLQKRLRRSGRIKADA